MQYAPWSEDDDGEGQPMTREQMKHADERAVAAMKNWKQVPKDSDDCSNAAADASTREFDDLVAQILAGDPGANEGEIRKAFGGARKAQDGNWYIPDPARPGSYLRIVLQAAAPRPVSR
jgi:hypothetical protein